MNQKAEIIDLLKSGDNFMVLSHIDPDGDSIGSMLGLTLCLRDQMGKRVFMPGPVSWPGRYSFLEKHRDGSSSPESEGLDALVLLDCSTIDRIDWGAHSADDFKDTFSIVIDHHEGGTAFGNLNWIDPRASAAGEMVFDLVKELGGNINEAIAESLFSAIVTDTGRFTFSNTTAKSLRICSELIEIGNIDPSDITTRLYFSFSEEYLRNMGIALYNSRTYRQTRIVLLTLDKASVRSFSTTFDETEGIVDLAMSVHGVELAALFKEISKNIVRASLRSRGTVDVGGLASELGGGGHHNAAGCTLRMPLSLAREVILDRFEKALQEANKKGEFKGV